MTKQQHNELNTDSQTSYENKPGSPEHRIQNLLNR